MAMLVKVMAIFGYVDRVAGLLESDPDGEALEDVTVGSVPDIEMAWQISR